MIFSYHGAVWAEAAKPLGPIAYILRARVILLRDLGAAIFAEAALSYLGVGVPPPTRTRRTTWWSSAR